MEWTLTRRTGVKLRLLNKTARMISLTSAHDDDDDDVPCVVRWKMKILQMWYRLLAIWINAA